LIFIKRFLLSFILFVNPFSDFIIKPSSPFFNPLACFGASNAEDTATMLHEMATVGVAMSLLVTAVWGIMLLVVKIKETKISKEKELME
jgi:hypothetical protein